MHTFQKQGESLWVVGYYIIRNYDRRIMGGQYSAWVPISDHSSEEDAMMRVNYLNGGSGLWEGIT